MGGYMEYIEMCGECKDLTPQPTQRDKAKKGKLLEELKNVVKEGDRPSDVKRKVSEIKLKESMGQSHTQLLYNFACELCEQYRRQEHRNFVKLEGIGLDPNRVYVVCDTCIEFGRANVIKPRNDDYDPID
ncbi:13540_t:CDS:2 [Gigaspora margarita]|uniref:13540_t:CDS:1 n=1 Tax=Gigaspora margarita TaxID=4874 RepID=A0ABM8VZZ9_GIGMA|nr:13540_t:CDS:2 [Gigaspora margarita]